MKIDPNPGLNGGPSAEPVTGAGTANSSQAAQPLRSAYQSAVDQASLSPDALQLSNLSGFLANVPEIRQDRVAVLQQAFQGGTYATSNQQIAQSMLRDFRMNGSSSTSTNGSSGS